MSSAIISVEKLGKCYLVGHKSESAERYSTLRDTLQHHMHSIVNKTRDLFAGRQLIQGDTVEQFWALDDISFEVFKGDVLGIIGHNGAGKSTLLKILSRITDPSRGRVTLRGRVASLLEVGTGFHPELSGRENIFLNGAILGMSRSEIVRKFDEIVAFAEVDRFLDTPVKRYSSGMYVRLAFAVAAHMDPEILIVDEVLAVGDSQFQRKCMGKMKDVSNQDGRTVLFVSHNMAAVKTLCNRAICLEQGRITAEGNTDYVLQRYMQAGSGGAQNGILSKTRLRQYGDGAFQFTFVQLLSPTGQPIQAIDTGCPLKIVVQFDITQPLENVFLEVSISDAEGRQLTLSRSPEHNAPSLYFTPGSYQVQLTSKLQLFPGSYSFLIGAHHSDGRTIDWVERALDFEVLNAPSDSPLHHAWGVRGFLRPHDVWTAPIEI